jgi:hypothetical protein
MELARLESFICSMIDNRDHLLHDFKARLYHPGAY